jgi:hypothetical protein
MNTRPGPTLATRPGCHQNPPWLRQYYLSSPQRLSPQCGCKASFGRIENLQQRKRPLFIRYQVLNNGRTRMLKSMILRKWASTGHPSPLRTDTRLASVTVRSFRITSPPRAQRRRAGAELCLHANVTRHVVHREKNGDGDEEKSCARRRGNAFAHEKFPSNNNHSNLLVMEKRKQESPEVTTCNVVGRIYPNQTTPNTSQNYA